MKKIITTGLILIISMVSCEKDVISADCNFDNSIKSYGSVLTETQEKEYYEIWKSILLKRNNLTEDDYNKKITNYVISSHQWSGGISFRVDYIMQIDWINIKSNDEFLIYMNSDYDAYPHLNIPRDIYFNESQIELNISNDVHSQVNKYTLNKSLKFNNCNDVISAAIETSGYKEISPDDLSFYVPGNVPRINGDPYMILKGTVNNEENACLKGNINLITGECKVWKDVCIIID